MEGGMKGGREGGGGRNERTNEQINNIGCIRLVGRIPVPVTPNSDTLHFNAVHNLMK